MRLYRMKDSYRHKYFQMLQSRRIYGKMVRGSQKADFDKWAKEFHISPVTARILRNRDLTEESEIQKFLYGKLEDCYSPGC